MKEDKMTEEEKAARIAKRGDGLDTIAYIKLFDPDGNPIYITDPDDENYEILNIGQIRARADKQE